MSAKRENIRESETVATDAQLMEQLKGGDMTALGTIYARYRPMVRAAIARTTPEVISEDAEEIMQDIFIALLQSAPSFDQARALKPWLYGISVNKAAGFRRTNWLHRQLLGRHACEKAILEPARENSLARDIEAGNSLEAAFAALPPAQHQVMLLHAVEGFRGEEIAEILEIEVNTVWSRLHRARKTLMAELEKRERGHKHD